MSSNSRNMNDEGWGQNGRLGLRTAVWLKPKSVSTALAAS